MRQRNGIGVFLVVLEILILVIVLVFGVTTYLLKSNDTNSTSITPQASEHSNTLNSESKDTEKKEEVVQQEEEIQENIEFSEGVTTKLNAMSREEKVAQLFVVTPEALTKNDVVTVAGKGTKKALEDYPVAGVVYTQQNFIGTANTKKLLSGIAEYGMAQNGLKLLLAVEEYGDDKSPVAAGDKLAIQPSLQNVWEQQKSGALKEADALQQVSSSMETMAAYLTERGINLNIAPKVEETNMLPLAYGMCQVAASKGLDTCMTVGSKVSITDKEQVSTPFLMLEEESKKNIVGLREIGYEGIIMSPSGLVAADAVRAVRDGCDIIYNPGQFEEAYSEILKSVNSGEISETRLNHAVGRTLSRKMEGQ